MKRRISLGLLFGLVVFCLCGCGSNEKNSNKELTIGDTLSANIFDFTITDVEFTKYVKTTTSSPDFYLPSESEPEYFYGVDGKKYKNDYGVAESGKVFVAFSFELKYTGKEDYNGYFENIMKLEYSDGYTFDVKMMYLNYNNTWSLVDGEPVNHNRLKLETLDGTTYIGRGYFEVPEEVQNNTNEPVKIQVTGLGPQATYKVR